MKTRDRWRKLARMSGDPAAWSAYRNYKPEVKRVLRLGRRSYIEQEKSSGSKCFSTDDKSVANNFNEFFTSVGSNTVTKIKSLAKENDYLQSQFVPNSCPEEFAFENPPYIGIYCEIYAR
jgi:hypothetical protein